ncbi:MAG: hypothetical protein IJG84_23340 [Kiritimatiellae bacterium]|nr:hypothetical protein [Kiritimatiellia bacterium]
MSKQGFRDFIFSTNTDGSGKAAFCARTFGVKVWLAMLGLLFVTITCPCRAEVTNPKLYAASGIFYYWFPGLEKTAGFAVWGGPDPLDCFKHDLWDACSEDFEQFVLQRLRDSYGLDKKRESIAGEAIQSVTFSHTDISFTWEKLTVLSPDPVMAADVANAGLDVLYDVGFKKRGTNTMFKVMVRAAIPTNAVTTEIVQRLENMRGKWCDSP